MSGSEPAHGFSREEVWRQKLAEAQRRYHKAVRALAEAQPASGESDAALVAATETKAAARQEYLRVLRIFTDLIVRGIQPKS